jgi:hypothetical protein
MPYLKFGRPNLIKIFYEVREAAFKANVKRVAVLCCEP